MDISKIDLNLLVFLDVLLRTRNVTRAADELGLSQPAMSNGLKRLRDLFDDPLLIRTSEGMTPTERATELQPIVRDALSAVERAMQPTGGFEPASSDRVFRIMASDYAESTLMPAVLTRLRQEAPDVILDILTPSDVDFTAVEQGKVDMVINRFDSMPNSFHQITLWEEGFSCIVHKDSKIVDRFTLEAYLEANHVWVSKTGMGVGVGIDPQDVQRLGWVDEALARQDKKRHITVFTRHYQVALQHAYQPDLVVTLPTRAAMLKQDEPQLITIEPPFHIPKFSLKMAWSPLLHRNPAHRWMRQLIQEVARDL